MPLLPQPVPQITLPESATVTRHGQVGRLFAQVTTARDEPGPRSIAMTRQAVPPPGPPTAGD
ncbi:hypothetical protein I547_5058 [Mycobacterium kansasii 824]|nr:hypothetical protein I547_5058 [Mycobacterium kansasii 824]